MSAATDIPDDVMAAAQRTAFKWLGTEGDGIHRQPLSDAIARAILAERQRCVAVAARAAQRCRNSIRAKQSNFDAALFESAAGEAADIATAILGAH
jgi:hypothetical protein